jgi:hypothetical protein
VGGGIYHLSLTPPTNFEKIIWDGNSADTFTNLVGIPDSIGIVVSQDGSDTILFDRMMKKNSEIVIGGVVPGSLISVVATCYENKRK